MRNYRYLNGLTVSFVTLLLCSNLIGAAKVCSLFGFSFGAGILFFPLTYLFTDILTEVYGYQQSRKAVWSGFCAMLFASTVSFVVLLMPPDPEWHHQKAFETVFGQTPRLVLGSLTAYFFGEFLNSYVLAKLKIATQGRRLWLRILISTIFGEAVDSALFYPIAFYAVWPNKLLLTVMVTNYALKVIWEMLMTPFTYRIVNYLKKAESEDYYDYKTNFSPWRFQ